jgi:hypothetical protein
VKEEPGSSDPGRKPAGAAAAAGFPTDDEYVDGWIEDDTFNLQANVELDTEDNLLAELQETCEPPVHEWRDLFAKCDFPPCEDDQQTASISSDAESDTFYDAPEDESQVEEVIEREKSTHEDEVAEREEGGDDGSNEKTTAQLFRDFSKRIRACAGAKDNMLDVVYRVNNVGETHGKILG